jgi:CheY-like chemotaxis protein
MAPMGSLKEHLLSLSCDRQDQISPAPVARNRVLVIDDDPVVCRMFKRSLEAARFDVVVASRGAEGLQVLKDDPTIGLVLLDLMMPDMDGWRFRHAQRTDPWLPTIPTIIVTGSALRNIVHEELQAADYLLKPVGREHLISVVASYCTPRED